VTRARQYRRWIGVLLLMSMVVAGFIALGQWQLERRDERRAYNNLITTNLAAPIAPAESLLRTDELPGDAVRWRQVRFTGAYDRSNETVIRGRYFDGQYGYEVITPLIPQKGPALLVNRGWVPAGKSATTPPNVPPAPLGEVSVIGRIRSGDSADRPAPSGAIIGLPVRAANRIDAQVLASELPYPAFVGYVELTTQNPTASSMPRLIKAPELASGPHLAYAVQWFFFALLAIFGAILVIRGDRASSR
jgi:cytochrome oxidase assembly protein ShyY1